MTMTCQTTSLRALGARLALSFVCAAGMSCAFAQSATAPAAQRVRGQIIALEGNDLQLRAETGQPLRIRLTSDYRVGAVAPAQLSQITSGAYVGVAAMPQPDGTLKALDVRIFPESMRGTGEGHRPMSPAAGSTMTNATVAAVATPAGRTMTNATVSDVANADAQRRITLKYATGEKLVLIQPDTPVLMIQNGERGMLVSGARVVVNVITQADGSLQADRVTVGLNGAVPPL